MATQRYLVAYPHPSNSPERSICGLRVAADAFVNELLAEIVATFPERIDDLKDSNTTLWKVRGLAVDDVISPSKELLYKWINGREENGERMMLFKGLGKYFPGGPVPLEEYQVHVMIVTTEIIEDADSQGGTDLNRKLMNDRRKFSQKVGAGPPPSDCVKNFANIKAAVTSSTGPRYGRPSDRFGPPTALFSKPLAMLRYNLEHLDKLTPDHGTITPAFDFVTTGAAFFDDEEKRGEVLQKLLKSLLGRDAQWQTPIAGGTAKPGGVWFEGPFAYLIFELKNEPGLGGDPFLQSLAVYSKIVPQEQYPPFARRSNLPVVLLSVAGNCLTVSTAVFTNAIYADKLLSIDLYLGAHGPENVLRVARIFHAIKECTTQLREHYKGLEKLTNHPRVVYPNPTPDPPEAEIPQLEFSYKLSRADGTPLDIIEPDEERHALYLAKMPGIERDVLVKFTAKYNEVAHRLLAKQDPPLAPTLHSCTRVVGDLYMVVMDYISASSPLPRFFQPPAPPRSVDAEVVKKGLTEALKLLHEKDLVFGDIRTLNILYSHESDRIFLVDFDWVGKHGEDRYSTCLNPEVNPRVGRWAVMKKSDDEESLDEVMKWLGKQKPLAPSNK